MVAILSLFYTQMTSEFDTWAALTVSAGFYQNYYSSDFQKLHLEVFLGILYVSHLRFLGCASIQNIHEWVT